MDMATGSEMFKSKLSRDYSYGLTKSDAGDVSCKIEFEAEGVCIALVGLASDIRTTAPSPTAAQMEDISPSVTPDRWHNPSDPCRDGPSPFSQQSEATTSSICKVRIRVRLICDTTPKVRPAFKVISLVRHIWRVRTRVRQL